MSKKFVINNIRVLSSWSYYLKSNTDCTICRVNLNANSLYNQDKGFDSVISEGLCGHTFHNECIKPWVDKNKTCPLCFCQWIYT